MLSIQPLKSAQAAADYYTAAFNYYAGDATAMTWLGKGSQILQLGNIVDKEQMLALLEGRLASGEKLQNLKGEHRPGFDMTFSAPKSVSLLVGLGVAPELIHYHDRAVKHAISQIEAEFGQARVRKSGQIDYVKTDNLVIAAFRQPSSRANDPALHTHCVTMNITFLDGKAKSLASDPARHHGVVEQIQNNAHYCGLIYRQYLANQLKDAGFKLRLTGDGLFEIDGIHDEVLKAFSKRREDIEQLLEEKGWAGAKSAAAATLLTRNAKEEHDIDILQEEWQARAKELNFDAKDFMQHKGEHATSWFNSVKEKIAHLLQYNKYPSEIVAASACLQVAIETLSQRHCVFTERTLQAECFKHSLVYPKAISQSALLTAIEHAKTKQTLYVGRSPDSLLTTPWALTLEAATIARIEDNKGSVNSISTKQGVVAFQKERKTNLAYPLTVSQKKAMLTLLTSQDRYLAIQGYAGVAKTSMLAEAKILMERQGYQLRGITIASSAAHELESKANIKTDVFPVVHQELKGAATGSLGTMVFIIDEASMLSSPQGHELIKQIERTQARLILVGDKAQLPSVNGGRIFSLMQDYGIKTAFMHEIVRQQDSQTKAAVTYATQGKIKEALDNLKVEELPTHIERVQWIAKQWLSLSREMREQTLLFAPTHANRAAITHLIREGLKEEQVLQGLTLNHLTLTAKNLEPIQQRSVSYYQTGDVLRFNKNFQSNRIKAGDYYTVGTITAMHRNKNILPLVSEQGKKLQFALKELPKYKPHNAAFERLLEVYQPKALELQVGDKLMWTRNFAALAIRNGQSVVLHAINDKELVFKTTDGNLLSLNKSNSALKHLDYSYVLTNYKVQGKDAPYGIGLMESHNKFGATLNNFYVQISRAKHGITLVTDNCEKLIAAINKNTQEKLASMDIISSNQLMQHENRFKHQAQLSTELNFTKTSQPNLQRQVLQELER